MLNEWNGFNDGVWTKEINVRNFIQKNYTLYEGDDSFLADVSQKTKKVWNKCEELLAEELKKGGDRWTSDRCTPKTYCQSIWR